MAVTEISENHADKIGNYQFIYKKRTLATGFFFVVKTDVICYNIIAVSVNFSLKINIILYEQKILVKQKISFDFAYHYRQCFFCFGNLAEHE